MTNKIEKTFFDTFGIEPRPIYSGSKLYNPFVIGYDYPIITDRILLELICILSEWKQYCTIYYIIDAININTLKSDILRDCLCMLHWYEFNKCGKDIKQQVRTLFEEEIFTK